MPSHGNAKGVSIRMKRLSVFFLLVAFLSATAAVAQTPAAQKLAAPDGSAKVAVVSFQGAIAQTNEFQRDLADLQKKYDPKRTQLKTLSDEIDKLSKQIQDQGEKLSDAERVSRTRTIDEKKKQLDRESQDAQSNFQSDMQQIINTVAGKVGELMSDFAKKNGYTLVLDAGNEQSSSVLYAMPSTDITKAVIDAYNTKSGIPAPAAQATPDAPKPQTTPAH
jgi:outer membrane protein